MSRPPGAVLGHTGPRWWPRPLAVPLPALATHIHVLGVSSSGKSRFLAGLALELLRTGAAFTLIDPHGDLARLLLGHLAAAGALATDAARARLVYLDLPAAARAGRFLPFNVLARPGDPHTLAAQTREAFHRAWPQLAGGAAPMCDTLVQDGAKVLLSNGLPLPALYRLLTDRPFRETLLAREADVDIVAFFRGQFDRLSPRDQADQAGAALRRAHLLTFAPVLKYSLGQTGLALDLRQRFDSGQSLILNLALDDPEARRLLGCLLTVLAEAAALGRADTPPAARPPAHYLIIDEFGEFVAQSEEALARVLSACRKYGLFAVLAHQTWGQAGARLRGALQNAGIEAVFRLGRDDAEVAARQLGRFATKTVRHATGPGAAESEGLAESRERWVQALQDLPARHAYLRLATGPARLIRARPLPDPHPDPDQLAALEAHYLARWFRPLADIEAERARHGGAPLPLRRIARLP